MIGDDPVYILRAGGRPVGRFATLSAARNATQHHAGSYCDIVEELAEGEPRVVWRGLA